MQITLTGSVNLDGTGGTVTRTLCSGPTEGPLDPFETEFTRAVQQVQPTGGDWEKLIPRSLRAVSLPFQVVKEFSTLPEAEEFCIQHEASLPFNCSLQILSDTGGAQPSRFTAQHAEVLSVNCRRMGHSVLVTYRILATELA